MKPALTALLIVGLLFGWAVWSIPAHASAGVRPFTGFQSGGNCVYVSPSRYVSFIAVVPVGPGGC